jgi:hypothetical protein
LVGLGERNTRPPAHASVARRANVEVLDHSLTNLPRPGTAARPPPEPRRFPAFLMELAGLEPATSWVRSVRECSRPVAPDR